MSDPELYLGGRLPPLARAGLTATQMVLWDRMEATLGRSAADVGFESKTSDGRFIGPFNPMLRSPETALTFLELQLDEARYTSLSRRVRQVVILSVGAIWKAPYELYAHAAAARDAGFSDRCIEALVSGASSPELAVEEVIAQRFALTLTAEHVIGDELYAEGLNQFGEKGIVDLAVLAGCYHLVCGVLNVFAVPAPNSHPVSDEV